MVVGLIRQIGAPRVINTRPFAAGKKHVEQFDSLPATQFAVFKQVIAIKNILVFACHHISSTTLQFKPIITNKLSQCAGNNAAGSHVA